MRWNEEEERMMLHPHLVEEDMEVASDIRSAKEVAKMGSSMTPRMFECSSVVILLRSFFAFPVISSCWRQGVIRRSAAGVCFSRIGPYSPSLP